MGISPDLNICALGLTSWKTGRSIRFSFPSSIERRRKWGGGRSLNTKRVGAEPKSVHCTRTTSKFTMAMTKTKVPEDWNVTSAALLSFLQQTYWISRHESTHEANTSFIHRFLPTMIYLVGKVKDLPLPKYINGQIVSLVRHTLAAWIWWHPWPPSCRHTHKS